MIFKDGAKLKFNFSKTPGTRLYLASLYRATNLYTNLVTFSGVKFKPSDFYNMQLSLTLLLCDLKLITLTISSRCG